MPSLQALESEIPSTMKSDRFRLGQRLRRLKRLADSGKPFLNELAKLETDVRRSITLRESRRSSVPRVAYDAELPVAMRRDEIADTIRRHQVVVISGETGSGKSTQLPKICLELGRGIEGLIGHTQPRRIAARTIAARIAEELGSPLGRDVGFKIRFTDSTNPKTYIKLMTDGILLAETQGDRFLDQYDTILLDEAHERSLNVDFLIGYLKRLLPKRRDLKLIITSATLDSARFAEHFRTQEGPAPVIEVSGRTYPVELRYRPIETDDETDEPDWLRGVLDAVDELARIDSGDVLVFMPTERDIHETAKALRGRFVQREGSRQTTEILPLYARLSAKEQQRVFQPHSHRRIVIATNVAESSLTVPGIRYVIDPGTARISRYSARSKTQRLPIESISRASADQRKGRCGRVGPGVCVRLYSEQDFLTRHEYTTPEIQRTNLAAVILRTKALKLGDVERFDFLDPPKPATIRDGYKTLFELGALDSRRELTDIGHKLSRLPVDPRIGRMILAAHDEGCLREVLTIAAALEIRDPRERPVEKSEAADKAHAQFADERSDFLTYLNLWDFYHRLKGKLSRNQLRKACRQNFLSYNRMREWLDIHRQLLQLVEQAGLKPSRRQDEYDPIHRAILTGMLSNVAMKGDGYEYSAAGGKFHIWPGSCLFKKSPPWLVASELVETTRRYLRGCAPIDPAWIEPIAEHLVKRTYSDPHWEDATNSAVAYERVTLFGLPVIPRRPVQYGPIHPKAARELLIQHGLVEGRLQSTARFYTHNLALLETAERLQEKLRRHNLLLGEWAQYEFYDERIPNEVYDGPRLTKWRKKVERKDPRFLYMTESDLIRDEVDEQTTATFPDVVESGGNELPLDYRFQPGSDEDGITISVPLEALGQLDPQPLGWLVPGLLEQKVIALIRSLPKPIRRPLVPVPDTAKRVLEELRFGEGSLEGQLASALSRAAGVSVTPDMFDLSKLPPELLMNVCVVDSEGEPIAAGRDLDQLRRDVGHEAVAQFDQIDDSTWNRDGLTSWDFDELPEAVEVRHGRLALNAHPMLLDRGESVSVRLADSLDRADASTRVGLRRLFALACSRVLSSQVNWLPKLEEMRLHAASIPQFDVKRGLSDLIASRAFEPGDSIPRTREAFEACVKSGRDRIGPAVGDVTRLAGPLFKAYHRAALSLERSKNPSWQHAIDDVSTQLSELIAPDFLTTTPWSWLLHFPRYFEAISYRLERLAAGSLTRDRLYTEEITARRQMYLERLDRHAAMSLVDPALCEHRWLLEEYRVSLFAQKLGTRVRISSKRLDEHWSTVRV